MGRSILSRALLPVAGEPGVDDARLETIARVRMLFAFGALCTDGLIYLVLRRSPEVHLPTLHAFLAINVPVLMLDCALGWVALRSQRVGRVVWPLAIALEIGTTMVWIQATGLVSSYFLFMVPVLIVLYRLTLGYRAGMIAFALALVMHATGYVLESAGVLPQAPLFLAGPGMYASESFRVGAMVSIALVFGAAFSFSNMVMRQLREKDVALDLAQRDLERAVERAQPGRLSGRTLARRYLLSELLGRGGMGEVYAARRLDDGAQVAVKVLYPHLGEVPEMLDRFRREAEVAGKLSGARVVTVLDHGLAEDGCPFLVMDLLKGDDLGAVLRRRERLPVAEALAVVDQLATTLEAAHAAGIVHRDLKPQNVFLVDGGDGPDVRLLDFGIARLIEGGTQQLTQTSAVLGSPGYLAPEQVDESIGPVDARSDVFSLGAVVYRMLTGKSAFPSRHPAAAVYEALHLQPPGPSTLEPSLSPDVDCVLALALAKRPEQRYATPGLFARDLRCALAGSLPAAVREQAAAVAGAPSERTLTAVK